MNHNFGIERPARGFRPIWSLLALALMFALTSSMDRYDFGKEACSRKGMDYNPWSDQCYTPQQGAKHGTPAKGHSTR